MGQRVQDVLRERVAEAIGDGASLDEVEDAVLRSAPLSAELRDALWLYAWGLSERHGPPAPAPAMPRRAE